MGDILTRLVQAGVRVTQFREVQTDLEEAFMSFARPKEAAVTATEAHVAAAETAVAEATKTAMAATEAAAVTAAKSVCISRGGGKGRDGERGSGRQGKDEFA